MQKDFQSIILDKMETGKNYKFDDVIALIGCSWWGKVKPKVWRAWVDLQASGRMSETINGYRKNN